MAPHEKRPPRAGAVSHVVRRASFATARTRAASTPRTMESPGGQGRRPSFVPAGAGRTVRDPATRTGAPAAPPHCESSRTESARRLRRNLLVPRPPLCDRTNGSSTLRSRIATLVPTHGYQAAGLNCNHNLCVKVGRPGQPRADASTVHIRVGVRDRAARERVAGTRASGTATSVGERRRCTGESRRSPSEGRACSS